MEKLTQTMRVMDAVRGKITSRAIAEGEKLPSIRKFARVMNVSPSTVVEAYDRLAAEGAIYPQRGSGFYVANAIQPFDLSEIGPRLDQEIDPLWVSRQSLDADNHMLKPGCGWMPADWMPNDVIRKAIRKLARSDNALLSDYGSTRGAANLRRFLSRQFTDEGLLVEPDKILLTYSGTQAIDLICRFLLKPGDTVLVDDPCYFNFQALLRAHQVTVVSVPFTQIGPDIEAFESVLNQHKPRLYMTNSGIHNPTGATLSLQKAHKLLKIASAHDLIIVEDDIFSSFESEPSPRMALLDGLERVIRIGSFSKTLSASMRCGYIAARPDWMDAITDLQLATNFGGPSPVATEIIYTTLCDGNYRKHMDGLRRRLSSERGRIADRLSSIGITPWTIPRGGIYLWCKLPDGANSAVLAQAALRQNIVLAPGDAFSVSQTMSEFMRFNVSQMDEPRLFDVLEQNIK